MSAHFAQLTLWDAVNAALATAGPADESVLLVDQMDLLAVWGHQWIHQVTQERAGAPGPRTVPVTVRCLAGGPHVGLEASQMLEAWLCHMPGLKVVIPATPADAKGLLTACMRDEAPCVFVEHAALYGARGPVPVGDYLVPLGKADVKRAGSDVTVITYGRQVHDALAAAHALNQEIDVEVLDLRSLVPWDAESLVTSVTKTRRALVVHEAVRRCGFGAEVAAFLTEELWDRLEAPVMRVASRETTVVRGVQLESGPSVDDIVEAVRGVVGHHRGRGRRLGQRPAQGPRPRQASEPRPLSPLEQAEAKTIGVILDQAGHNLVKAAAILGISRTTLYRKLRIYGLGSHHVDE